MTEQSSTYLPGGIVHQYLAALAAIVIVSATAPAQVASDWLIDSSPYAAKVEETKGTIVLSNGLIRREIRIAPNAATVALDNLMTGQNEIRSVRPEAAVTINGISFEVGGLTGQPIHNYISPAWLDTMKANPSAFTYSRHSSGKTKERLSWKPRTEWMSSPAAWPPPGVSLDIEFNALATGPQGVTVTVHYELYDGIPLFCKWLTVKNTGSSPITIDSFKAEILAAIEPASLVEGKPEDFSVFPRSLHVETDFAFGGSMNSGSDAPGVAWKSDPLFESQVHYERRTPCLLECGPAVGPSAVLESGKSFDTFRVFELLHDSTDRECRGLAVRRMYRTISPWVLENPLIFHVRSADPASVRAAVDQAAEVGFELVLMTFGSGFEIENNDPKYIAQLKTLADYAHSKGIALGGYSLLSSRSIDVANDVVNPATGKTGGFARFGNAPCIGSQWGQNYFRKLYAAFEATGLDVFEHDGSYPGDVCASTNHPGHKGLADSQWSQWKEISTFYAWCRGKGIYLNVPDWYYLAGSNKCGMGYRETNWSLPREQQEIIERQNIFDGTWTKTPSMGWMFVPLTEYQGGGPAATIEPLHEHLDHYQRRLANLLGAGVQACYRGPRLYDTDATRDAVRSWVTWFKSHRSILESDIIHGRRADGRDIDWLYHVNPALEDKLMLVVYNPTDQPVQRTLSIDTTYSGLADSITVSGAAGPQAIVTLDHRGRAAIKIDVPARGMSWYTCKDTASAP